MSFPLIIRAEAEKDLADARDWYEQKRTGLGTDFLEAAQEVFDRIREMPELYAEGYRAVRRCKLARFRHVVYYRFESDTVTVLGVLHGSRNPAIWRSRARES